MKAQSSISWSRRRLLLAGLAACGWHAHAADEAPHVRILFFGNSYMAHNRLPGMVGELMLSSKVLAPHIGSHLLGNYTLEQHSTNADGLALLKQGADDGKPWDVIVVQEQSLMSAAAAVDAKVREQMEGGLSKLVSLAREVNPQVLVVDFQVWSRQSSRARNQRRRMPVSTSRMRTRHRRRWKKIRDLTFWSARWGISGGWCRTFTRRCRFTLRMARIPTCWARCWVRMSLPAPSADVR